MFCSPNVTSGTEVNLNTKILKNLQEYVGTGHNFTQFLSANFTLTPVFLVFRLTGWSQGKKIHVELIHKF